MKASPLTATALVVVTLWIGLAGAAQFTVGRLGDCEVVLDDIELRPPGLGEVGLARVRQPHLAAVDLEHRVIGLGHVQFKTDTAT